VLADIYTYVEHRGPIAGRTVAWIGDSNNMCNTWLQAATLLDFKLNVASPPGYELESSRASGVGRGHLELFADPLAAAREADLVTTDVWTSMGWEEEADARKDAFAAFTVDAEMMAAAGKEALFMHCLPAHRGEEVTAEVLDGPQSVVWDEAENRLHAQKALHGVPAPRARRILSAPFTDIAESAQTMKKISKVVLAYSGGLDTSVILKWLQDTYGCEVITFNRRHRPGRGARARAQEGEAHGVKKIFVEDLREEFVRDFVFPMFRANALYEGEYLLGTSIARPLIAKRLVEVARKTGADAISHGATGKGNDQVRFELGAYALMPEVRIIAPWREWDLLSRDKLLKYAEKHGIPVDFKKRKGGGAPYSMDANLLHISYEGGILEDPAFEPRSRCGGSPSPREGAGQARDHRPGLRPRRHRGGEREEDVPAQVLTELNRLGGKHGVGRLDLVENRSVGMKSRGCYETPGGTIMLKAHRAMESLTLDREVVALKDDLMPRYARLVYAGYWFSPERKLLQTLIDASQEYVNGRVRVKLYKGTVLVVGRSSKKDSLFDTAIATFEEDQGAYNQADAEGFIKLNALRMRIAARHGRK